MFCQVSGRCLAEWWNNVQLLLSLNLRDPSEFFLPPPGTGSISIILLQVAFSSFLFLHMSVKRRLALLYFGTYQEFAFRGELSGVTFLETCLACWQRNIHDYFLTFCSLTGGFWKRRKNFLLILKPVLLHVAACFPFAHLKRIQLGFRENIEPRYYLLSLNGNSVHGVKLTHSWSDSLRLTSKQQLIQNVISHFAHRMFNLLFGRYLFSIWVFQVPQH